MRTAITAFLFSFLSIIVCGQNTVLPFGSAAADAIAKTGVNRNIKDNGLQGVDISYRLSNAIIAQKNVAGIIYSFFGINGFSKLHEVGKPALPANNDLIALPANCNYKIKIIKGRKLVYKDYLIHPALRPATDTYGDPEPEFEIDTSFYNSDIIYPDAPVKIIEILKVRGVDIAVVQVCPVQYNPLKKTLTVYPELKYKIEFTGGDGFFDNKNISAEFSKSLSNYVLNSKAVSDDFTAKKHLLNNMTKSSSSGKSYIIITQNDFIPAADSIALWKQQLGYSVEIISRSQWSADSVRQVLKARYQSWTPKPDYFLIIGDHTKVPGMILQDPYYLENYATDHYYACMDSPSDYVADMAYGRIASPTLAEAIVSIRKMINYEKNPPANSAFYSNGLNCAYFQDDDTSGYETRCFSRTAEDVRNYMLGQGFKVKRVYSAKSYVSPTHWNNNFYYNGEPIPDSLKKPVFPWTGATSDIKNELNSADGKLFVFHRDHGFKDITNTGNYTGWTTPKFDCSDVGTLTNGDKLPVVFSINCYTGKFMFPTCLAQKFLQKTNGGGVGVFAAANMSLSGPNDGLSEGLFDAIWSNPGLVAHFTGFGADPQGTPTTHSPIYTMGDVLNQGLMRMVQTWGNDKYTFEIMQYFGDPAMKIWTSQPVVLTANVEDSLHCKDTVYNINSSNCSDCMATLVVDGVLYSQTQLSSGAGTLHFPAFTGGSAVLTLSKHNYKPFIKNIPLQNNCLKAKFTMASGSMCIGENIIFTNASSGNIISYKWNFGTDASPATAATIGPHTVSYTTSGYKTVKLTVKSAGDSSIYTQTIYIEPFCSYLMPFNGYAHISMCNGVLYDNGGDAAYASKSNDTTTILIAGAASIRLNITDFDVQAGSNGTCNKDRLEIYDGASTAAPLIGSYCNTQGNFPPNTITSTAGAITFRFVSDSLVNGRGFKIEWNCEQANSAPNPNFYVVPTSSCDGIVNFYEISTNSPSSWLWDFGDGSNSSIQNPSHIYSSNGTYNVSLKATNQYGNNTIIKAAIVFINRPTITEANSSAICKGDSAVLNASAEGRINWYSAATGGTLLYTGNIFTTPNLDSTKTYYLEVRNNANGFLQPYDTLIGSGLFYAGTTTHYMLFDCYQTVNLLSVKVFAKTTANREIQLLDASNNILKDTIINIPQGESRVGLNFIIPAGYNYKLVCVGSNNLYRNSTGAVYPYRIDNYISINGNSFGNPNYYYFFYNWEIQMPVCISPRIPVSAVVYDSVPSAHYTYIQSDNIISFTNTSHYGGSYYWDFDDGENSFLTDPVHTYTANGTYHVKLKAANPCDSSVFTDIIDVYTVGVENFIAENGLSVYPNPVTDELSLKLNSFQDTKVEICITDVLGKVLWKENISVLTDVFVKKIDMRKFASGIYFIKLNSSADQFVKKVVKY